VFTVFAVAIFVGRSQGIASVDEGQPSRPMQVAFIGNSMLYFNDFPRFFEIFSGQRIKQNSCLQGGGNIPSYWIEGNAMFPQFGTDEAIITTQRDGHILYDYGACTVPQLLTGTDDRLDDPGYAVPSDKNTTNKNPCREDHEYLEFSKEFLAKSTPQWDFIVVNDNTKDPARSKSRARSLQFLESFYVPLLQQTGAIPVLIWTHAYSNETTLVNLTRSMTDVANFTSLTIVGYKEYANLLKMHLPKEQTPRIAPVGMAFLTVYEENEALWHTLFHSDHLHASPSGTFLQGLCIYYTLFGEMPPKKSVVLNDMTTFWTTARMMQHAWEPPNPYPSRETASYLYDVAVRVLVEGHVPDCFIDYQNGESAAEDPPITPLV
jgi:hypothetical protein